MNKDWGNLDRPARFTQVGVLVWSLLVAACESGLPTDPPAAAPGGEMPDPSRGATEDAAVSSRSTRAQADAWASARRTCGAGDFYEPNETAAQSCRVSIEQPLQSELAAPADTGDHYSFLAAKDVIYTVTLDTLRCSSVMRVGAWIKASGQPVEILSRSQGSSKVSYELKAGAGGETLLRFGLSSGSCAYTFAIYPSTAAGLVQNPTTLEPNDAPPMAANLGAAERTVTGDVAQPQDVDDYYAFDALKDVTYTLSVSNVEYGATLRITVWTIASGQPVELLDYAQTNAKTDRELTPNLTGPVRVRVWIASGSSGYSLRVLPSTQAGLARDPMTLEPNDSPSTAAPLAEPSLKGELVHPLDAIDHYTMPVRAGTRYTLTVQSTQCATTLGVQAWMLSMGRIALIDRSQGATTGSYEFTAANDGQALLAFSIGRLSCSYEATIKY